MIRLPHPIPYQGSKRSLAPLIARYVPSPIEAWYEPFVGSAAMTIWAAHHRVARRYIIGDSLRPICELWTEIVERPAEAASRYRELWNRQTLSDFGYFNRVRDRYNSERDPVDLLYLICRCVKNAVRFNAAGRFTQSVDKRRLGMRPEKMEASILGVSAILRGRTEIRCGDWLTVTMDATPVDFIYMDPPYEGTTVGRDKRYAEQLPRQRLIHGISEFVERRLRFALSYDGMTGGREYGEPLPPGLGLTRLLLHAGVSSQSTLIGRKEETIESLYLSPGLAAPSPSVIRPARALQESLTF